MTLKNLLGISLDAVPPDKALDAFDLHQGRWLNRNLDPATATRVKAMADQPRLDARTHPVDHRQEAAFDKVERRCHHVVGPALDGQARRRVGQYQRHQDGLQDETGAASRADFEMIIARRHTAWRKGHFRRADSKAIAPGISDTAGSLDGRDMLAHQPWLAAPAANGGDPERLAGDERQRARIAHDLPSAFAFRSIDDDHGLLS